MSTSSNTEAIKWQRLFVKIGIPGKVAAQYTKSFVAQRIQFSMLDDLDKSTLLELGVTALGDQMAILRHIRARKEAKEEAMDVVVTDVTTTSASQRERITGPSSGPKVTEAPLKRGLVAPDRDDIYHIRMPEGNTPRTREIMKKHHILRSFGLLKRGSNGVRKSGKEITPISRSIYSRIRGASKSATASSEVSSTTDEVYERLGVRGLVSDSFARRASVPSTTSRTLSIVTQKDAAENPSMLFKRAISETVSNEPIIRVRIADDDMDVAGSSNGRYNSHIQSRVSENRLYSRVQRPSITSKKSSRINRGFVQKRVPVQSRITIVEGISSKKKRFTPQQRTSVFDRLG